MTNANRFRLYFVNFGYFAQEDHADLDAALAHAKKACFEVLIYEGEDYVASWSPIGGTRTYRRAV